MARGKHTCKILKEIRRQIAEANGIEFVTSEWYLGGFTCHAHADDLAGSDLARTAEHFERKHPCYG